MTTDNNVADQGGLDTLSEQDRKETKEILDEIAKDDATKGNQETTDAATTTATTTETAQVADKSQEDKDAIAKAEAEKNKSGADNSDHAGEKRRAPKLIPAWVHERAKAELEKENSALKKQIEEAAKGSSTGADAGNDGAKKTDEELEKEINDIAEQQGVDPKVIKAAVDIAVKRAGVLPPGVMQELEHVRKYREQQDVQAEEVLFSADFERQITPLIKAEYGESASQEVIDGIKEKMKSLAYSPEFANVTYTMLYKGSDQFRGIVPTPKRGAESSRGGTITQATTSTEDDIDLTKPLADDVIGKLSDKQFEIYSDNMQKYEKSQA